MCRPCGTEGRPSAPFWARRGRAEARRMRLKRGAQIRAADRETRLPQFFVAFSPVKTVVFRV